MVFSCQAAFELGIEVKILLLFYLILIKFIKLDEIDLYNRPLKQFFVWYTIFFVIARTIITITTNLQKSNGKKLR